MSTTYHITGTLVGLKTVPNKHNFNRTNITKMTVMDKDGSRYHGTRPLSLINAKIGDKITFKAEISRSERVKSWFFVQRPRMVALS